MTTAKDCSPQALSPASVRAYAGDWELFTDWCTAAGHQDLPAEPVTVAAFLADNPAAAATLRRRVAAINQRHRATGYAPPGRSPVVSAALGRPTGEAQLPTADTLRAVEAALRVLPSHGWTHGIFGRRDRCLLVLSELAGVSYKELAALAAGTVTVAGGVASISAAGATTLTAAESPVLCGPCTITRWLRVLDTVMTRPSHRVLAKQIKDADPVTNQSLHLCRSAREFSPLIMDQPLIPSIDQWGYLPFPLRRLTPHSLSRLAHQMLIGEFVAHRTIATDDDELPEPEQSPAVAPARSVYTKLDADRAWAKRRADLDDIAGIGDVLDEIDGRAKELNQRVVAVLAQNT